MTLEAGAILGQRQAAPAYVGAARSSGSCERTHQLLLAAPLYLLQPSQKAADSLGVGLVSEAHTWPPLLLHLLLLLLLGAGSSAAKPRQRARASHGLASAAGLFVCARWKRPVLERVPTHPLHAFNQCAPGSSCLPACLPAAVLAMPSRMRCEARRMRYYGQLVI